MRTAGNRHVMHGVPPGQTQTDYRHGCGPQDNLQPVPDYFGDLNAMHEAEKTLTDKQWAQNIGFLHDVCKSPMWGDRHVIGASAAEKAEALGQALGLWKEGE